MAVEHELKLKYKVFDLVEDSINQQQKNKIELQFVKRQLNLCFPIHTLLRRKYLELDENSDCLEPYMKQFTK